MNMMQVNDTNILRNVMEYIEDKLVELEERTEGLEEKNKLIELEEKNKNCGGRKMVLTIEFTNMRELKTQIEEVLGSMQDVEKEVIKKEKAVKKVKEETIEEVVEKKIETKEEAQIALEDVRKKFMEFAAKDKAKAKKLLNLFKVDRLTNLEAEHYSEFLTKLEEVM